MSILGDLHEARGRVQGELRLLQATVQKENRDLTTEEAARARDLGVARGELDERIAEVQKQQERADVIAAKRSAMLGDSTVHNGVAVSVTNEPLQYGPGSPHSYYADLIASTPTTGAMMGLGRGEEAKERLTRYSYQLDIEVRARTKIGSFVEGALRESRREAGPQAQRDAVDRARNVGEYRTGIATGGGATASAGGGGGAFVTPVFFVSDYAPYREAGRAFIDSCNKQTLPEYGMTAYMPQVTAKAGVASQTEGSGVNESDPTMGYLTGSLVTKAGQVIVTQQLLDRVGPNFEFDRMIFDQLQRDYNAQVDTYALTTALATAGSVTYTGSWAFTTLMSKLAGAVNAVETTNGTIQSPTHIFMQPSRFNYIEATSLDNQNRPLLVPNQSGPFNAFASGNSTGGVPYEGDTGYKILGLPVYKDLNIPTPASGADQVIVGNLREVYVYEGQPVTRVLPQTLGQNLQCLLQLYAYITEISRYPLAIQTVTGTGLAAISY